MSLSFYFPKGVLQDFVEYIGFLDGPDIGTGVAFPRVQQVIIINMGTPFSTSDIYLPASTVNEFTGTVWVNGMHDHPFMLENKGITAMYAIGLRPGRLTFFARLPAMETTNGVVGAEHWTSEEIFQLREQLLHCSGHQQGFRLIEQYLTRLLYKKNAPGLEKIQWMEKAIQTHTVQDICRMLGVTRKKLRSETQYYFGHSVKAVQGIIRFNQALGVIAHSKGETLSSLHDYYDQSHFIHDFKARTGITPLQYKRLCQVCPAIQYTPNFVPMKRETFLQFISAPGA